MHYLNNLQNPQRLPNQPLPKKNNKSPPCSIFSKYPWLVFDENGLWCIHCMLFRDHHGTSTTFCSIPFTNYKKVYGNQDNNYLMKHENSTEHMKAAGARADLQKTIINPAEDIQNVTKKICQEEANKYIKGIKLIFKSLLFLIQQGIAIRGHDESATSKNKGNLLELIDFLSTVSPDLDFFFEKFQRKCQIHQS